MLPKRPLEHLLHRFRAFPLQRYLLDRPGEEGALLLRLPHHSPGIPLYIQVCLMSIRKNGGSITIGQVSTLYDLVVDHYKKIEDVDGDGYYLVSALAFFVPNDRRLIDDFWKYIDFGLKKTQQEDVFKSTISCICDFASTYREQISDKVDPVIE